MAVSLDHHIGGERVPSASGERFADISPIDQAVLAEVARGGAAEASAAVGAAAGQALVADDRVARISFTGSVPTARRIAASAAASLTPTSCELGGKSPFLVFADADLELAADLAGGQYGKCRAGLPDRNPPPGRRARGGRVHPPPAGPDSKTAAGRPAGRGHDIGPQITREHLERVDGFVQRATAAGAQVLAGGGPNAELGGLYYQPTLLTGAEPGAEILTAEVFGPVLTLQTFDREDQAVALANSTEYGLAAVVVTGDPDRARRVSARLVAGTVWVNCFFVRDLRAPFGGSRNSGIGRDGGNWSFDFYCDVKHTVTTPDGWTTDHRTTNHEVLHG